ncbi:MAG: 4-alpha-glucanotransferase [Muribaculaceae bacterium]|nr:4-alpha-glucanotransferase [Muribaculaceae bacterium]
MKITFYINYHTNWGESLWITGDIPQLGELDSNKAVPLDPIGADQWTTTIEVPDDTKDFPYIYSVRNEDGTQLRNEWGSIPHVFRQPKNKVESIRLFDRWQDMPWDKPFYSSAIVDTVNRRFPRLKFERPTKGDITITVDAPMIASDEIVAISGDCEKLGKWSPEKALEMNDADFPTWSINIPAKKLPRAFEYKFLIKKKDGSRITWENGNNRSLQLPTDAPTTVNAFTGLRLVNPFHDWKAAGVAIPVFSVRTEEDFGVGDFFDLMKMVDWAVATGQKFLQILPINDTTMSYTWQDSYPYNANSTFALHPMYLRLEQLGLLKDAKRRKHYEELRKQLNELHQIDYELVTKTKAEYTREIFEQEGAKTLESNEFKEFVSANSHWLKPYAAFCVLRDKFHTPDFTAWGEYAVYEPDKINRFIEDNKKEIEFVFYVQYHLDRQMRTVSDYARSHGVAIKGDIPIGISRTSADAWQSPLLFNMNTSAGAPPDDFSVLGQNWGFPTYNWDEMAKDGFAWWKARFRKMAEYFDAYRIDHVLGFFRIWQIPEDALHGLLGVFHPALPFSPEELRNSYDFWINVSVDTKPFIMEWFLNDFFGEFTDEAKNKFLISNNDGSYRLKEEFDTQKKVAEYFAKLDKDEKNTRLCNALLGLIDDVLFIEDPYQKGKYHPRISAQFTYRYRSLNDYERWCFDRLYNDFYYHRHNDFWYDKAMWKLPPLLESTNMLTCAEDLGMIPSCVPAVMDALQILALEIQRMPKDPKVEFGQTRHYPYLSVCTTSTHDMSGIRGWWEENREKTSHFYHNELHEHGDVPFFAEPWICEKIVNMNLHSPSMLCILPLQDWLSISPQLRRNNPADEQINVPANSRHYWRYRMHLTVEKLLEEVHFNRHIASMIHLSGR